MNRVAIAFLTKNRVDLSRQTVEPLLRRDKFDLWWMDGSKTEAGRTFAAKNFFGREVHFHYRGNVVGGADAAIVYALTALLDAPVIHPDESLGIARIQTYSHIGICENDVLLDADWFEPTMALFEQGARDGLSVGAVSARAYEDRVLIQRDGYAVMHNLGAGVVIFTREAARLVLDNYRTTFTSENRAAFSQLSGIDIGSYWAFRGSEHWLTVDWSFDKVLASHGLCSLALTPCKATMIGQDPPLEDQGLKLIGKDQAGAYGGGSQEFETFRDRTRDIREGSLQISTRLYYRDPAGAYLIFPHQLQEIGGSYEGEWRLKWSQGFGPFVWKAEQPGASLSVPVFGPAELLFLGGPEGGQIQIVDDSGFTARPDLPPEKSGSVVSIMLPGNMSYRTVRVTALSAGICFYGLRTREAQPWLPNVRFDHSVLPPI